jgi:hypothetical protein
MTKTKPERKIARSVSVTSLEIDAPKALTDAGADRVLVAIMFGVVMATKITVNNQNGDVFDVLKGQFEGRNVITGEVVNATSCFVPIAQEQIVMDFKSQNPTFNQNPQLKFRADIYAVKADNKHGFIYDVELPMAMKDDMLEALRSELKL